MKAIVLVTVKLRKSPDSARQIGVTGDFYSMVADEQLYFDIITAIDIKTKKDYTKLDFDKKENLAFFLRLEKAAARQAYEDYGYPPTHFVKRNPLRYAHLPDVVRYRLRLLKKEYFEIDKQDWGNSYKGDARGQILKEMKAVAHEANICETIQYRKKTGQAKGRQNGAGLLGVCGKPVLIGCCKEWRCSKHYSRHRQGEKHKKKVEKRRLRADRRKMREDKKRERESGRGGL